MYDRFFDWVLTAKEYVRESAERVARFNETLAYVVVALLFLLALLGAIYLTELAVGVAVELFGLTGYHDTVFGVVFFLLLVVWYLAGVHEREKKEHEKERADREHHSE